MKHLIMSLVWIVCFAFSMQGQKDYSKDTKSLDQIVDALYSVISGDKGVKRDWDRMRYLFADGARLMPTRVSQEGQTELVTMSVEDYIQSSGAWLEQNGFFEKEIHRVTEQYGSLVHLWSTYESYRTSKDETPFARGINSIQLILDDGRWKIIQIYWLAETPDNPIPDKYLP